MRAAGYGNLIDAEQRRAVDRQAETFVVEGTRAIQQVLDAGWPLDSVFLSEHRVRSHPLLVQHAAGSGVRVFAAEQSMFDRIVGYHAHRGALALARRPAPRSIGSVLAGVADLRLVLVVEGVNDHENLGALFRNAAAFGAAAVVLDPSTADPLYRRSVRVSVGHVLRVPFARAESWPSDLEVLRGAGFRLVALTPRGDVRVDELGALGGRAGGGIGGRPGGTPRGEKWALMVGAEGDGLSEAALAAADVTARISIVAGVDSLNVATAAAVALHRLAGL